MTVYGMSRALAGRGSQDDLGGRPQVPDNSAGENKPYRDELGSAQNSAENRAAARVITKEFQEKSRNTVEKKVCPENLAIEFLAFEHPGEKEEDAQLDRRLKQLGGLQRVT